MTERLFPLQSFLIPYQRYRALQTAYGLMVGEMVTFHSETSGFNRDYGCDFFDVHFVEKSLRLLGDYSGHAPSDLILRAPENYFEPAGDCSESREQLNQAYAARRAADQQSVVEEQKQRDADALAKRLAKRSKHGRRAD
jgi:hypothetical protein